MSMIEVSGVTKIYRQHRRFPGTFGALRSLLTRQYSEECAVRSVSFSVKEGEAVGYMGPNGAGKSTMIKMLAGILVPTSGEIRVLGTAPHQTGRHQARQFGAVFGQRTQLRWDWPVKDSFELRRAAHKMSGRRYRDHLSFCTELLAMKDFIHKPLNQLSPGQRMRVEMAMAMLHEPKILFLDEPTIGLDVAAKDRIRHFLRTVNRDRHVAIVLATHDMQDIEEICPRMILVSKGNLVYDGSVSELRSKLGGERRVVFDFRRDPGEVTLPGARLLEDEGMRKTFLLERGGPSALELINGAAAKYPVEDAFVGDVEIEYVIHRLYRQLEHNERLFGESRVSK